MAVNSTLFPPFLAAPNVSLPLPIPLVGRDKTTLSLLPPAAALDARVTEWLKRCEGGDCDVDPQLARFRFYATELIERQAARMWGTWQSVTHDNVLMNEALAYTGYDVYVEGLDLGLDTYLASLNFAQRAARAQRRCAQGEQQ